MADPIKLVAVERGFAMGRLVHPGETFLFDPEGSDGKPRKIPKWAAKPGDARTAPKAPVVEADLKPKATQVAVSKKRAELAGG